MAKLVSKVYGDAPCLKLLRDCGKMDDIRGSTRVSE